MGIRKTIFAPEPCSQSRKWRSIFKSQREPCDFKCPSLKTHENPVRWLMSPFLGSRQGCRQTWMVGRSAGGTGQSPPAMVCAVTDAHQLQSAPAACSRFQHSGISRQNKIFFFLQRRATKTDMQWCGARAGSGFTWRFTKKTVGHLLNLNRHFLT